MPIGFTAGLSLTAFKATKGFETGKRWNSRSEPARRETNIAGKVAAAHVKHLEDKRAAASRESFNRAVITRPACYIVLPDSEQQLRAELQAAIPACRSGVSDGKRAFHLAEIPIAKRGVRVGKLGRVRDAIRLGAEFQVPAFRNPEPAEQRCVQIEETWTVGRIAAEISELACRGAEKFEVSNQGALSMPCRTLTSPLILGELLLPGVASGPELAVKFIGIPLMSDKTPVTCQPPRSHDPAPSCK